MARPLNKLYEMARPRGAATWAMLDWAAEQEGDFTAKQLQDVYIQAGGGSLSAGGFRIVITNLTAPSPDQASEKQPLIMTRKGQRGSHMGAGLYAWGLDRPLRQPPPPKKDGETAMNRALDALEDGMGGDMLKKVISRWRNLHTMDDIIDDIQKTIPLRLRVNAIVVATDKLLSTGDVSPDEVKDAEAEVEEPGQQSPFLAPAPKPKAAIAKPAPTATTPEPVPTDDDDDEYSAEDGWSTVPSDGDNIDTTASDEPSPADSEPQQEPDQDVEPTTADADDDDAFWDEDEPEPAETEPDSEDEPGLDTREYPIYLPDPDDEGDKYERAMFDIVSSSDLDEYNPIWDQLKSAKNDIDASRIIKLSKIPPRLHRAALLVAHAIFDNTGRDWETGKPVAQKKESRFFALFRDCLSEGNVDDDETPSPEKRGEISVGRVMPNYGLDEVSPLAQPVDFAPRSGLKRIMQLKKR